MALGTRRTRCRRIRPIVAVLLEGNLMSIAVDGLHLSFGWSYFESAAYTHCSIFRRFASHLLPAVSSSSSFRQYDYPPWFYYDDSCYHNNLQSLPAAILVSAAKKMLLQSYWLIFSNSAPSFW
jgi:hypothetical protein